MYSAKFIDDAFKINETDKHLHGYAEAYSKAFTKKVSSLLEIGVQLGESLLAWRSLFNDAELYGIDITDKKFLPELKERTGANIIIGNSTDLKFTKTINKKFDYIIDDGSHFYLDILQTFDNFKDKFTVCYIIEDVFQHLDFTKKYIESQGFTVDVELSKLCKNRRINADLYDYGFNDPFSEKKEVVVIESQYILTVRRPAPTETL